MLANRTVRGSGEPLDLVHGDICGPIETLSVDTYKYFVKFFDETYTMSVLVSYRPKIGPAALFKE